MAVVLTEAALSPQDVLYMYECPCVPHLGLHRRHMDPASFMAGVVGPLQLKTGVVGYLIDVDNAPQGCCYAQPMHLTCSIF